MSRKRRQNSEQELSVVATYQTRGSEHTLEETVTVNPITVAGHWKFNEGSGSVAVDSSDNGNDGTIHGATRTDDGALSLDGSDDYVDCGNPGALRTNMPMTVSMWFKPDSWSNGQNRLLDYGWRGATDYAGYSIMTSGSSLLGVYGGEGYNFYITRSDVTPEVDQWHHVVYIIENGNQELYLDGTKIEDSNHTASIVYGSEPLYIGASTAGTRFFNGSIDDVRIYNETLSPDEVKYLNETGRR